MHRACLAWRAAGEDRDPLATSLVAFETQKPADGVLAQLSPFVSSEDSRFFGTIRSRQSR